MKGGYKRTIVIAIVAIVIVVGAWLLLRPKDNRQLASQQEPTVSTENAVGRKGGSRDDEQQLELTPEELLAASQKLQKAKQIQQASNRDIRFYGKVVDQLGEPVPDAEIRYNYAHYPDVILPTFSWSIETGVVRSNADGEFEITDKNGVHLTIEYLHHPSYKIKTHNTFHFRPRSVGDAPFASTPTEPVIFRAWKKGYAAKELLRGSDYWTYRADGKFYKIPMEGLESDLQVHFALLGKNSETTDRQWRATLKLPDGGLIEASDTFMYEAPETGYQPEWSITAGENDWVERKFYFKARNGQIFGRIHMKLAGYYGDRAETRTKGFIDYDYALNPTGSRNLLPADE